MNLQNTVELPTINNDMSQSEFTNTTSGLSHGFKLKSHYTLKFTLDEACYNIIMYGDMNQKKELKRVIVRTYCLRIFLILPLISGVVFGALYLFLGKKYSIYYLLIIFIFLIPTLSFQVYYLMHYLASVHSKQSYMKLNKSTITRIEMDRRERDQLVYYQDETERVTYTLPPPLYSQAAKAPPAYESTSYNPFNI
ncbi:hypothetical protein K502DRAFT_347320 [Neoconidiobolus thromboides FSU 785]|nr:hypothetical protein K502DRAFT_347320 [Neoconidiobolus thromboides FSU 785]